MRSEGSSDCSWTGLYSIVSAKKCLKLKKYSLSDVHFNTGRLLFEVNGLQYRFAAGQVFVAFANPVSVSFGKSIDSQKHKHCQLQTTPPSAADIRLNTPIVCSLQLLNSSRALAFAARQAGGCGIWTWESGFAWCLNGPCLRLRG